MEAWSRLQAAAFFLQPHRALHFPVCGVLPAGNYFATFSRASQRIKSVSAELGSLASGRPEGHADRTGTRRTPIWVITMCNCSITSGSRADFGLLGARHDPSKEFRDV